MQTTETTQREYKHSLFVNSLTRIICVVRKKSQLPRHRIWTQKIYLRQIISSDRGGSRTDATSKMEHFVIIVKACVRYFLSNFYFFYQMTTLQKLWKVFFISSKKLFLFSRYSIFCNFLTSFPHFPDIKGQMEVE